MRDKIAKYLKKKWYGARISLGEHNELKNRYMHIRWEETAHSTSKQHIEQHIGQHIQEQNSILNLLDTKEISSKMKSNITKLYEAFGMEKIFGRSDVIEVLYRLIV